MAVTQRLTDLGIITFRCYGSTEHPSITGSRSDAPASKRLFTDGCPLSGVEIKLADDGEILSRRPDLCLGYTDDALTAAAFDDDGWYHTGDVGMVDPDGYLTITDRNSDIIVRGGENISAAEVEEALLSIPGVAEAVVVAAPGEHATAVRAHAARARSAKAGRRPRAYGGSWHGQAEVARGAARGRREHRASGVLNKK